MRTATAFILLSMVLTATLCAAAEEPALKWLRRLDEAKKVATAEKKDLLINFTGHGWCYACSLLHQEVFTRPEFAEATKYFVLVELDFPSAEGLPVSDLKELYRKWETQYLVQRIPTVVLADADGRPYAYTGYYKGVTAEQWIARVKSHLASKQRRDERLAEAHKLTGVERARKLHSALQAVAPLLGNFDERGNDPLLVWYGDVVAEIRKLDADNAGGLRRSYDERIAARDAWQERETVFRELDKFSKAKEYPQALALIDKTLPGVKDPEIRWRLELSRLFYLQFTGPDQVALGHIRRLLDDPGITPEQRNRLLEEEDLFLFKLGRIDEVAQRLDQRISEAPKGSREQLRLLNSKAQYLLRDSNADRKIASWRDFRAAAVAGSKDWATATGLLALVLAQENQHEEAIALYKELIKYYHDHGQPYSPEFHLSIARSQLALGRMVEAQQALDQAENEVDLALPMPQRREQKETRAYLRTQIARMRKALNGSD
jgi:thioredoxin-related protein/tetratricopeptide (TPR) repeat protein